MTSIPCCENILKVWWHFKHGFIRGSIFLSSGKLMYRVVKKHYSHFRTVVRSAAVPDYWVIRDLPRENGRALGPHLSVSRVHLAFFNGKNVFNFVSRWNYIHVHSVICCTRWLLRSLLFSKDFFHYINAFAKTSYSSKESAIRDWK